MRTALISVAAAGFVLAVSACGESSAAEVTMVYLPGVLSGEPFVQGGPVTMTGTAVEDGVVCAAGQGVETALREGASTSESLTVGSDLEVTCDDGSGTFVVTVEATVPLVDGEYQGDPVPGDWTIVSGTGRYAQLEGGGDFSALTQPDLINTYDGELKTG